MEIEILALREDQAPYLDFRCAFGLAWGCWMGDELPKIGDLTHVELEFSENILAWRESRGAVAPGASLRAVSNVIIVTGRIERISENEIFELRIGTDIALLEESDGLTGAREGTTVEIEVIRLDLYPMEL